MAYSVKNHIHNRKNYKMGGLVLNIIKDNIRIEKDNVMVEFPLHKFEKIIKNMDGSITHNKMKFKIPKKLQRESNIFVTITDAEGNSTTSEPISSIHYNSEEHVHLIQHLENKQDFLSVFVHFGGKKINVSIQSQLDFETEDSRFADFNLSVEKDDAEGIEKIRDIIKFYNKHTDNKVILYDIDAVESFLGKKIKGSYYDFKNDFDFLEYITDIDGKISSVMPIENVNLSEILNRMYFEKIILNDEIQLKEMLETISERKGTVDSRSFNVDFKVGENLMIHPSLFIKENEKSIIKYFDDELSDFSPWDGDKIFWILEISIKKKLPNIIDHIIDKYCAREEDNDFLDHRMNLLFSCFLSYEWSMIPHLLKMYVRYDNKGFIDISDDFSMSKISIMRNQLILNMLGVVSKDEVTFELLSEFAGSSEFSKEDIETLVSLF